MTIYRFVMFIHICLGVFVIQLHGKNKTSSTLIATSDTIISGLHTLSIHIKDPAIHDSVFHFLTDKLQLPVYYHPVAFGERKYAGVFAGNLILEPCGPYKQFKYATRDFKAIFFGLTFEPALSIPTAGSALQKRRINHDVASDEYIYLNDSLLCGENIFVSIMNKYEKVKDHVKLDSLRIVMETGRNSDLGIEYVKEIQIAYANTSGLKRWEELISPSELNSGKIWKTTYNQNIRFLPGNIKEVKAIIFKVKSLEKAKKYLSKNNITFTRNHEQILLGKSCTFGLTMFLEE